MSSRLKHALLISIAVVALFFTVEHGYGTVIEYTYDASGNLIEKKTQTDTTAPTTTNNPPAGTYNTAQSVTLTCDDGTGSGCDKIYYTTNGTTPTTSSPVYSSPINISVTTTLKFFAKDKAGNSESVKTGIYTINTNLPSGTITINSGAASTNSTSVTLTLSCTDPQGCSQMRFSNDNVTYSTAQAYATTKAWTLTSGNGTKTVYVKYKDTPGNWSIPYSDTILLDTAVPTTTASPSAGTYNIAQSVTLTCSDGTGSGCDKIYYTTDGSTPTTSSPVYSSPINISDDTILKYFAKDLANNTETIKTGTYIIDEALCPNFSVRIGSTSYLTIQDAYNAAVNGNVIKCRAITFIGDININRNITVTLDGGYDCGFTTNAGGVTTLRGKITTTAGGGTITMKNFVLGITARDDTPPITTVLPEGGFYKTTQWVILTCSDVGGSGCEKTYYTTDGSTPTIQSPVSPSLIKIPITTTLKYFSTDIARNNEEVKTQIYTIDPSVPVGVITINSGATFTNSTSVTLTLSCTDSQSCTQMRFSNEDFVESAPEAYATTKAWTLTAGEGIKTVYVKFKDMAGNWSTRYSDMIFFEMTPPTTTASPPGGVYGTPQTVTLTCSDGSGSGCDKIYYTTDGTTPTTSSPVYTSPINIPVTTTLKFFAKDWAGNSEAVKSEGYTIEGGGCSNPPVKIGSTPYTSLQAAYNAAVNGDVIKCRNVTFIENLTVNRNITVTLEGGYNCEYTTNGGGVTTIKGSLTTTVGGGTITVKNFNIDNKLGPDTTPPTTTASPGGGTYNTPQSVTLTCIDTGGSGCDKIYYTTDGSTPTTSSPVYTSPINISVTTTLKFFAKDLAGNSEAVKTQIYTITTDTTPPTTTATPAGGTYSTAQSVTLTCVDTGGSGCDKIYYTTDGTTPTTSSPVYSSPINISVTTTLKFFAKDLAGNSEAVKTQTYTIDGTPPTTTASPPGGTYTSAQSVTLSCSDGSGSGCDKIYYTTDGSTPTTSSPVYASPINISVTTTLKFFAKDLAGNSEDVKTQTYTISSTFTIGETNILSTDFSGYGNWLIAQRTTLGQTGTILSMSFYVKTPSGNLRLGIYDATGPNGGPGALKAQTAGFTPVSGWNTQNVISQVSLPPGTYWLAFLMSSDTMVIKAAASGQAKGYTYYYGPLPATFSTSPTSDTYHWSFYATLQ